MSEPFVAEIRIFPFNFAPTGWAFCQGQLLPISQNTALFSLLGTNFGGDGRSNFGLPNFQGCAAVHQGQGPGLSPYIVGQTGGNPSVTLTTNQLPGHTHSAACNSSGGTSPSPANNYWAPAKIGRQAASRYSSTAGSGPTMNAAALAISGGSQPHNNMAPYLTLNFCIALQGIYPARS